MRLGSACSLRERNNIRCEAEQVLETPSAGGKSMVPAARPGDLHWALSFKNLDDKALEPERYYL